MTCDVQQLPAGEVQQVMEDKGSLRFGCICRTLSTFSGGQTPDAVSELRWGFKVESFRVPPFVACGLRFVGYGLWVMVCGLWFVL